jgi:hypothetical protein
MKRVLLILVVLLAFAVPSIFAEAVGGGLSYGLDTGTGGGTFLFSIDPVPFTMVGINIRMSGDNLTLGLTDDYWIANKTLSGIFKYYVGIGFYAGLGTGGDQIAFDLGVRAPIGLQAFILDPLELFIEIAPAAGFTLSPVFSFPNFGFQGLVGARFWF